MRKARPKRSPYFSSAVGNGRKPQRQITQRELRFAQGVAQGKSKVQAAIEAGYSKATALKKSWKFVDRPHVQNILTEAMEASGITAEKIVQPIKDGLEACEVVRTEQGKILTDHPDHKTRLMAHDRAVELYGLKGKHADAGNCEPLASPPVTFQINFVSPPKRDAQGNLLSPTRPEEGNLTGVKFVGPGSR